MEHVQYAPALRIQMESNSYWSQIHFVNVLSFHFYAGHWIHKKHEVGAIHFTPLAFLILFGVELILFDQWEAKAQNGKH